MMLRVLTTMAILSFIQCLFFSKLQNTTKKDKNKRKCKKEEKNEKKKKPY